MEEQGKTTTNLKKDEYVKQEIDKLSKDAEILFPNWELFGLMQQIGCNSRYIKSISNERLLLEGTFFDIVCHISENGICYNYIRLKQAKDNINEMKENITGYNITGYSTLARKADGYKIKVGEDDASFISQWMYDTAKKTTEFKTLNLLLPSSGCKDFESLHEALQKQNKEHLVPVLKKHCGDITQKDIIFKGEQNVQELNFDINKFNRKCFFHTTKNNRSIGVFIIFDKNDKKYAIICNYTNKDDINKIKSKLRKNYTIINLPQVQNDNHSCSVLNKIFLAEMHKFFVEGQNDINELLNYKDKEDNNGDIALTDEVKTLFPNLYQYQQYNVASDNCIPNNFKSNLLVTDKYNIIKDKNNPNEDKIFNLGLLREGWCMAIDFISENIDQVPLCELEIFIEIFEKQCNFFDRVISLQTKGNISTNKDYFKSRETAIEKIKDEILQRQKDRKNGKEKLCDFVFDTNLSFLLLSNKTNAVSPKLCEYINRYKAHFCQRVVKTSGYKRSNKYCMKNILPGGHNYHPTYPIDYGTNKDEGVDKIVPRKPAFEGNEAIRNGLRNEYQEKYKYNEEQEPRNTGTDDRNKPDMSSTIINLNNDTLPLNNNTQQQLSSMQCKNCPSCNCLCSSFCPSTIMHNENEINLP